MSDQDKKQIPLPVSGIIMFLAALGVVVFARTPLKEVRPVVPPVKENTEKVNARLWQDPFRAVLDQSRSAPETGQDKSAGSENNRIPRDPGKGPTGEPVPVGTSPALSRPQSDRVNTHPYIQELKKKICTHEGKNHTPAKKTAILGVMVFGTSASEQTESRMRTRYAVLAGLRRLDYYPETGDSIDYVITDDKPRNIDNILPFEWMIRKKGGEEHILLLWINDNAAADGPLDTITELADLRSAFKGDTAFKIIGPAGSTNLIKILQALEDTTSRYLNVKNQSIEIFSATATIDIEQLPRLEQLSAYNKCLDNHICAFPYKGYPIHLERTIGTDKDLARQLIAELCLRGVNRGLAECRPSGSADQAAHKDYIMLISEWDTFYGRFLPKTFIDAVSEIITKNTRTEFPGSRVSWVDRISYLRGIDGAVPGEKAEKTEKTGGTADKTSSLTAQPEALEQAFGKSQYDYLRRLADDVYNRDLLLKRSGKGAIAAIGVLGSDFYDKYLVLHALRERLPQAVYFTTDLDARYFQSDTVKWTRNLIVASNFGLELSEKKPLGAAGEAAGSSRDAETIQGDVPPFRDTYQTAVFLATLRAFKPAYEGTIREREHAPLIFEIGKHKPTS